MVLAVATNGTGPVYVPSLEGELTFTVANADAAKKAVKHTNSVRDFNMQCFSKLELLGLLTAELRALTGYHVEGSDEMASIVAHAANDQFQLSPRSKNLHRLKPI